MNMSHPAAIHLHIDTLVLRDFERIDAAAVSAALHEALRRELSALVTARGTAHARMHANIHLPAEFDASGLGRALARTLVMMTQPDAAPAATQHAPLQGGPHD